MVCTYSFIRFSVSPVYCAKFYITMVREIVHGVSDSHDVGDV
jgi:hypothetical protein